MQKSSAILWIICFLVFGSARAQQQDTLPQSGLLQNFENVTLDSAERTVYYEQRLYRNPFIGLVEIQQVVKKNTVTEYVPLFQGVPVGKYELGATLNFAPLGKEERQAYYRQHPFRPMRYKFDFWLQPLFAASFGNFSRPVESNTSLMLQSQFFLARGLALNWGILFPVVNQLDDRPAIIRPAPIFLNQFLALGKHQFVSASAGFFHDDQYGINLQYRYMPLGRSLSFGTEAGLSGLFYFTSRGVYYGRVENLLLLADVTYRLPRPDLIVKLSGGQYLHQDVGGRLDIIRQFPNVEVGLFTMKTQNGATIGFNFAVPIPPGKIVQGKRVRLRTGEEFRWEYIYAQGFDIGERYRTGYQLDQKLRQYHRQYLQGQYRQY